MSLTATFFTILITRSFQCPGRNVYAMYVQVCLSVLVTGETLKDFDEFCYERYDNGRRFESANISVAAAGSCACNMLLTWFRCANISPITSYGHPSLTVTYLLTPWSRVLFEKLTGLQIVKKFPAFYEAEGSLPHS
jgi:hypothetical protein